MVDIVRKGLFRGKCNRSACPNTGANWWSPVERAHYCETCAKDINNWTPPGIKLMYEITESSLYKIEGLEFSIN